MKAKEVRLYIHIPFCESKCCYCDFASFVCGDRAKYFDFLCDEIAASKYAGSAVTSIYFGGGTPSSVAPEQIERVMRTIKSTFKVKKDAEVTIECNPASNSLDKLKKYKSIGINRISFGVQSLKNSTLKFLNRRHDSRTAKAAIMEAKKAGFKNISADLIIGVDDGKTLTKNAKKLIGYGLTHLSAYMLQIEENTPLFDMVKDRKIKKRLKLEDECVKIYDKLALALSKRGFERYEISNFCKRGFECRHNLGYWTMDDYLGFGLAAHSYLDGKRIANPRTFDDYYAGKKKTETLTDRQKVEEIIMLGLRCREGFSPERTKALGYDVTKNKNLKFLLENGYITLQKGKIKTNPAFYGVCNSIILKLLPD